MLLDSGIEESKEPMLIDASADMDHENPYAAYRFEELKDEFKE